MEAVGVMTTDSLRGGRAYRRGSILGLTIAETFILIAFALLMLLLLWRLQDEEETRRALTYPRATPEERTLLDDLNRAGSPDDLKRLLETGAIGHLDSDLLRLIERGAGMSPDMRSEVLRLLDEDMSKIDKALEIQDALGNRSPSDVARMLEELQELKKLRSKLADLEAASRRDSAIPRATPEERALLDDIAGAGSTDDLKRLLETGALSELDEDLLRLIARAAELSPEARGQANALLDRDLSEINEALALKNALGDRNAADVAQMADELDALRGYRAHIEDGLGDKTRARARVVRALNEQLGELVTRVGGEIDETGAITLPDTLLFDRGSAAITPHLAQFLDAACAPWVDILYEASNDIGEIRIEGHASSEWRRDTPATEAYFRNLSLSQERSKAVLEACLRRVDGSQAGAWARAHATAAGYSSSQLVRDDDGIEDKDRSRRVVFRASINTGDILTGLEGL